MGIHQSWPCRHRAWGAAVALLALTHGAWAQAPTAPFAGATLKVESTVPLLSAPEVHLQRFVVARDGETDVAFLRRHDAEVQLVLGRGKQFALPLKLDLLVSRTGGAILMFGDELLKMDPRRTNLYWLDTDGRITQQVQNRYAGDARVSMSSDGFTAIAARDYFESAGEQKQVGCRVDLYSPKGERLWEGKLPWRERPALISALPRGKGVVVQTGDAERPLQNHRLQVFYRAGRARTVGKEFRLVQKILILDSDSLLFVQGIDSYGLVDLDSGETRWTRPGKIRMISPYAAAVTPDESLLLLLTGDQRNNQTGEYRWTLTALDLRTGRSRAQIVFPRPYPSTWDPVFEQVGPEVATILAGNDRIRVAVSARQ